MYSTRSCWPGSALMALGFDKPSMNTLLSTHPLGPVLWQAPGTSSGMFLMGYEELGFLKTKQGVSILAFLPPVTRTMIIVPLSPDTTSA